MASSLCDWFRRFLSALIAIVNSMEEAISQPKINLTELVLICDCLWLYYSDKSPRQKLN